MSDSDSYRFLVTLPAAIALLVFLWWLWRQVRKPHATRASLERPVHVIVIQDKIDSENGTTGHDAPFRAYEEQCIVLDVHEDRSGEIFTRAPQREELQPKQAERTKNDTSNEGDKPTDRR